MPLLKELLNGTPEAQVRGDENADVAAIAYDSRQVGPGTAFVCVRGHQTDGHDFIPQAIERGATVIIAQDEKAVENLPENVTRVLVPGHAARRWRISPPSLRASRRAN